MKVRIGIADTSKVVEIEIDDLEGFQKEIEKAVANRGLAWFTDTKGRTVGVPTVSVAFVEIEGADGGPSVGFAASA
ncbi:MAG: DUF3107 family protein [Acidimicrobiia bacterium]